MSFKEAQRKKNEAFLVMFSDRIFANANTPYATALLAYRLIRLLTYAPGLIGFMNSFKAVKASSR
jgi:hypothetical protein